MDKSRDANARPEVQARLDAMVKAGWSVGRTWGFSLGSGLSDGPLGQVISDPSKTLETAPGETSVVHALALIMLLLDVTNKDVKGRGFLSEGG